MKKTYIQPNTVVVSIMHTQPIAGSNMNVTSSGDTFDLSGAGTATSGAEAMTKGTSDVNVWDDEW